VEVVEEGEDRKDDDAKMAGLRMACGMNAMALNKLAMLDIRDAAIRALYHHPRNDENNDENIGSLDGNNRSWSKTLQEAGEIEDMLGMASRVLLQDYQSIKDGTTATTDSDKHRAVRLALASAACLNNQGIAQIFYLVAKRQLMERTLTADSAVYIWTQALDLLDGIEGYLSDEKDDEDKGKDHTQQQQQQQQQQQRQHLKALTESIRARIYCNMAWTILFFDSSTTTVSTDDASSDTTTTQIPIPISEDQLKLASDYAGKALKSYETLSSSSAVGEEMAAAIQPSMGRALGLVAHCYARAGSSVTAEGLFQTAVDYCTAAADTTTADDNNSHLNHPDSNPNPVMMKMDARDCLSRLADLCRNWEKRGVDAERHGVRALEVDRSLGRDGGGGVDGWRGKNGLYSGLWFFSIGDF